MKKFKQERFNLGDNMARVTAGPGGEVILLWGTQKTAILDCGMAFCGEKLVGNVKNALEEIGSNRTLDYILLSHTHYDHVGGLGSLKKAWPTATVLGSGYAKYVLNRPGALKVIRELSVDAADNFKPDIKSWELDWQWKPVEINYDDSIMQVEQVIKDGDRIDLGDKTILVIETRGHTDCSLSFFMEGDQALFASESLGVYTQSGNVVTAVLKSYVDTLESVNKCKKLEVKHIISPHFCKIPGGCVSAYWDKVLEACESMKDIILELHGQGYNEKEILERYTEKFWVNFEKNQQPKSAFLTNGKQIVSVILKEFA